jgi:hypothetical protein
MTGSKIPGQVTTTPPNLEKWTFPSCRPCNAQYGKIEEELRLRFAAGLEHDAPGSAGVLEKAFDSINPNKARNPLDALKRKWARQRFRREFLPARPEMSRDLLHTINRKMPNSMVAMRFPTGHLNRLIEKLVRGTVYLTEQRYIELDQEILIMTSPPPADAAAHFAVIQGFSELHERGPGIRIRKAVSPDAKTDALFVFDIWEQFRFYGAVVARGGMDRAAKSLPAA